MWDKAKERARAMLSEPDPGYVDQTADRKIRDRFNILLED